MGATRKLTGILVLGAVLYTGAGAPSAVAEEGATFAALQLAYQREVNAQWHYLAYSVAARRDGQPRVASLFRAVARGEAVHAANHLAEIERLGGTAVPRIESVVVRTAGENLAAAIEGERLEREEVYRMFADFARRECLYEALATFNYARGAEATHLEAFGRELERFEEAKPERQLLASLFADPFLALGARGVDAPTFVCPGCGSVFGERPAKSCPNCRTAGARFAAVL